MEAQVKAALEAAKKYKPRNAGDAAATEFIIAALTDVADRVALLGNYADTHEKAVNLREAEAALLAAQTA